MVKHKGLANKNDFSNEVFHNLLAIMPGYIYWMSKEGVILGCNEQQAHSFGLASSKELIGKSPYDVLPKGQADALMEFNNKVISGSLVEPFEEILTYQGRIRYMLSHKVPLFDNNGIAWGTLGISIDVTELKDTQQALKEQILKTENVHRSKAKFLSTASHEIRNPLGSVISILDNLYKDKFNELKDIFHDIVIDDLRAKQHVNYISIIKEKLNAIAEYNSIASFSAHRALIALENLDDLHRLHMQAIVPKWLEVEVVELIDKAIKKSTFPNDRNIKVETDIKLSETIFVDEDNLRRSLSM
ncbi:MAG TPA: PAS domain-containing protein, partial [Gammaproteobacteria bacterium]|nr:PAS domain-containing protein [Gammaproteobacteria bacterium]